jgi:integrase
MTMARRKAGKRWSYLTGERGRNRIRAFEKERGKYYLEWREEDGRKKRLLLRNVTDREAVKEKADELAVEFGKIHGECPAPLTIAGLLDLYLKEVTPTKGSSKRSHDRRALRVWRAFLDSQPEVPRRSERPPSTLDRVDWDRFIHMRRKGLIPGWARPVRDRQIQYDVKFLVGALNWATGRRVNGQPVLKSNPWGSELRRAQRWIMPRELNPHRPGMTEELRSGLMSHAPGWQFRLALILGRETRRRNNAIRQLTWADINLERQEIRWRGHLDKAGREQVTLLTDAAAEELRHAPSRGIGQTPVFPSASDLGKPTPRNTFQVWLQRAKSRWIQSLPEGERAEIRERLVGIGFHAEKRAGVRDPLFRALPPSIQEAWAGTRYETLRTVYDEVTPDDIRVAYKNQRRAASGSSLD